LLCDFTTLFRLRDYGAAGQIGLEETPAEYVAALVEVFREVKRVLRPDGNCWLNLGDSYLNKQLLGIPWRVAFALQDIGFYLRSEVIWFKTNSMPESVNDRPTRCHEQIFLFTKSQNYFYDIDAIREPSVIKSQEEALKRAGSYKAYNNWEDKKGFRGEGGLGQDVTYNPLAAHISPHSPKSLLNPVSWQVVPQVERFLTLLAVRGTTGRVAAKHGRDAILIELNPGYGKLIDERTDKIQKVFTGF
jgi:DNA modification methylase